MAEHTVYITLYEPKIWSGVLRPDVDNRELAEIEAKAECRKRLGVYAILLRPLAYSKYEVVVDDRIVGRIFIKPP